MLYILDGKRVSIKGTKSESLTYMEHKMGLIHISFVESIRNTIELDPKPRLGEEYLEDSIRQLDRG